MNEEMQRKMSELESYKKMLQQYQQQKSQIMMGVQELVSAKSTIEGMKNIENGTEIIIPIGGGTFIKGRIDDPKSIITSVGADIALTKDVESAKEHIDAQIKAAEDSANKMDEELQNIEMQAQKVYMEIESSAAKEDGKA